MARVDAFSLQVFAFRPRPALAWNSIWYGAAYLANQAQEPKPQIPSEMAQSKASVKPDPKILKPQKNRYNPIKSEPYFLTKNMLP